MDTHLATTEEHEEGLVAWPRLAPATWAADSTSTGAQQQ